MQAVRFVVFCKFIDLIMKLSDFDFELPAEAIAQKPVEPRDSARLLDCIGGQLADRHIYDLPDLLRPNDLLIVNNTKVIPAQLTGQIGAGKVGITLHKRDDSAIWRAFAKPARKCSAGVEIQFAEGFSATVIERHEKGEITLQFNVAGTQLDEMLLAYGRMPLPPYIKRPDGKDDADDADYQTLFARHSGAVAAPTAGLHFTPELYQSLQSKGVHIAEVTLHVGAGTFLPVQVETIADHKMHSEWGSVSETVIDSIKSCKAAGGRVICVGTTSLRIMESAYAISGQLAPFTGDTDIFITPGFQFGVADMLLTNFHLPKSTLLMLVSAFSGRAFMLKAYQHAIDTNYRFFSYGDACLLQRQDGI